MILTMLIVLLYIIFDHVEKIKGKESFSYIFNDNINYIRFLYNRGKIRNVTYDSILKTILFGSIYLGYDLLRNYFLIDRSLLNLLFIAARNTLACVFNDAKFRRLKKKKIYIKKPKCPYSYKNDKNKIIFGSVLTLHIFGRDLKWNSHIHCLFCEEAFDTWTEEELDKMIAKEYGIKGCEVEIECPVCNGAMKILK